MAWRGGCGPPTRRVQRFLHLGGGQNVAPGLGRKDRGRYGDAGADAGLEVVADAGLDGGGAAVGLEALEIEAEALGAAPEVRVIDVSAVLVERVDHLEEMSLQPGGLGRPVQGRRARVLAGDGEVAEDGRCPALTDLEPSGGAVRTAEVGVDDQRGSLATTMILGADRRNRGAGQLGRQESASKIRLAPGISSGVGDSCTHSTMPSSSTRTSERLAWPVRSM